MKKEIKQSLNLENNKDKKRKQSETSLVLYQVVGITTQRKVISSDFNSTFKCTSVIG